MTSGCSKSHRVNPLVRRAAVFAVIALGVRRPPVFAQLQAPASSEAIRVAVERVDVGVIVTDSRGRFVENLRQQDFQVLDNGAPQTITDFVPIDAPGQILMAVEAGPAVYLLQDSHLFVVDALLGGLSSGDRIAIVYYNAAAAPLLNFTAEKPAAQAALDQIQFNLGYGSLNLSSSLNTVLDWLAAVPGKKTVVLVSTGVDTSAPEMMKTLLGRLQTGDVRILAVSMSGPLRNGSKGSKQQIQQTQQVLEQADAWLKQIADSSGGRAYFPENAKAFQEAYRQIAQLVRHEYSLAFAPPAADGAVHSIEVKMNAAPSGPKEKASPYQVDHRRSYIAPRAR